MTRRTIDVTISLKNRDEGKKFRITEMPAEDAEEWAIRMIGALAKNGVEIPDEVMENPTLAGLAYVSTKALGRWDVADAIPLLKQMMSCVSILPNPGNPDVTRALMGGPDGDIEEVATRIFLRGEVISLHLGFSILGAIKSWREAMAAETAAKRTSGRTKTRRHR